MLIVYNTSLSLYIYVYPCAYVCVHVAVVELDGDIEFTHEIPVRIAAKSRSQVLPRFQYQGQSPETGRPGLIRSPLTRRGKHQKLTVANMINRLFLMGF
jgi:hypothetical protein